jgi:hypothetical protein
VVADNHEYPFPGSPAVSPHTLTTHFAPSANRVLQILKLG